MRRPRHGRVFVLTSLGWRIAVSHAFSHRRIRRAYLRFGSIVQRIVGVALAGFGARLLVQGGLHRG